MKINQDIRLKIDNVRNEQKHTITSNVKFGELVQKQEKHLKMERIELLLSNI